MMSSNICLSRLPPEIWIEHLLPFLKCKDIISVALMSKFYTNLVNINEDVLRGKWQKFDISLVKIPGRKLVYTHRFGNLIMGSVKIDDRWGLTGLQDCPLITVLTYNSHDLPFYESTADKVRKLFGRVGLNDYNKNKANFLCDINNKMELVRFDQLKTDFPDRLPLSFLHHKKKDDVVYVLFASRLFCLTCTGNFQEDIKIVKKKTIDDSNPFKVDEISKKIFIDLDKDFGDTIL